MDLIKSFSRKAHREAKKAGATKSSAIFDQYEDGTPSDQQAVDLLPGWNCSFPSQFGLTAGPLGLFDDERIIWALERFGSIQDKAILEVGPLEAMHTFMLNQRRPARIDAVEANRLSFMRCLITAQILGIDRARFWLGDISKWLEEREDRYDLIVASGVLYHMMNPPAFIERLSRRTDAVFLWTHFYLEEAMPPEDPRRIPFSGKREIKTVAGIEARCYERSYKNAAQNSVFCGGLADRHYWMHRDDIVMLLRALGFDRIEISGEDLTHPGGPCFCVLARRTNPSAGMDHAVQS